VLASRQLPENGSTAGVALTGVLGPGVTRAISVRGAWRTAAALYALGALSTILALLLLEKEISPAIYATTAGGVLAALACLGLSARWPDPRWLAVIPVLAVIQVTIGVAVTDYVLSYLYFFVALWVAVVFPTPRQMVPYLGLIAAAVLIAFAWTNGPTEHRALWLLAVGPPVILAAIVVGRITANLQASKETYRKLSRIDGLTGVGNYRALIERLNHETARHARRERPFALLSLDLDDFKAVNEAEGHRMGDLALAVVGATIELAVRTEDTVCRQGGDEFSVVAPETGVGQAAVLATRIEKALERVRCGPFRLTATIGTAMFPRDGTDAAELLEAADAALRGGKPRSTRRVRLP
jgi:diguanylate cyclase (GGDEF)-like protein